MVAIAFLALIAIVAGQRLARPAGTSGADDGTNAAMAAGPSGPAPDISQMSPDERASRLYELMMSAYQGGHMDTVQMFAPMATAAYEMLDSMTLDQRYELGRLGEISGDPGLAAAEADTILTGHPNYLLGLVLGADAAHATNDTTAERRYLDRLRKVAPAEEAKKLPGYQAHASDIKAALALAQKH